MAHTLFWVQGGGCGGDSMALLNLESPNILQFLNHLDIQILWHPSFSIGNHSQYQQLVDTIISGEQALDILCIEGAVIRGPGGSGMYDTFDRKPKKDLIASLARKAKTVMAVGTCASFGGIGADGEVEATGLQFHKSEKGGFLGLDSIPEANSQTGKRPKRCWRN